MYKKTNGNIDVGLLTSSVISTIEGKQLFIRSEEEKVLALLKEVEKTCASLLKLNGVIFHCDANKRLSCCDTAMEFLRVLQNEALERIESVFPECRFNPFVKAVVDAVTVEDAGTYIRQLKIYENSEKMDRIVVMLNRLVDGIRTRMGFEKFKTTFKNYKRGASENRKELFRLVDSVFRKYAKVLVVRLDLSYKKSTSRPLDMQNISHEDVRRNLRNLLKDLKGKIFKEHLISYVWKLEYGPMKGYHYHIFFFFDGSKVMRDIDLAERIGEHWSGVVTGGIGGYFNCNKMKERYRTLGIGMIGHRDSVMLDNLKNNALGYLLKLDYYIRPIADDKIRTFGKGAIPKPVVTARGRPRVDRVSSSASSQRSGSLSPVN
jgi:hypothetical protein